MISLPNTTYFPMKASNYNPLEYNITDKFWILNDFQHFLNNIGIHGRLLDITTFCTVTLILLILLRIAGYAGSKLLPKLLHATVKQTPMKWNKILSKRHFFKRIVRFAFTVVLSYLIETIFMGYSPAIIQGTLKATKCLAVFFLIDTLNAMINAVCDIYNTLPRAKERSIKGYVQTVHILVYIIGILIAVSIIADIRLSKIFLGLATSAAILTLVFKDTLLGFTASIQLSAQDMIRLGDWIQMDSQKANGIVTDMTVSTVKVQNWDNTFSMVPIYAMISQSFINWRGMYDSAGRQFLRPFPVDINSIRKMDLNETEMLKKESLIEPLYDKMLLERTAEKDGTTTNLALFRAWILVFLSSSDLISKELMLLVRYLPMEDKGIIIQIYGYTVERRFVEHEEIMAHITEQIVAVTKPFGIKLFQRYSNESGPYPSDATNNNVHREPA